MAVRKYRRLHSAGQNAPPGNLQTLQILQWGICLIAWPTEFDMSQAPAAWEAHRQAALDDWQLYWRDQGILPTCWGQRVFDGAKQIPLAALDAWQRDRIKSLEGAVKDYRP